MGTERENFNFVYKKADMAQADCKYLVKIKMIHGISCVNTQLLFGSDKDLYYLTDYHTNNKNK
jgi:hypothetical protein